MNPTSEAKLVGLYPVLVDKVHQMAEILLLDPQPITLIISAGLRSWLQQDVLWLQGRNPDGTYIDPVHHTGVVTNARGGESWHNYGVAVDCEPEVKDGTIDWNASHPQWKRMEAVGASLGMTTGANWKRLVDAPHFQITGRFPVGAPDEEAKQIYQDQSREAFWDEITKGVSI